MASAIEEGCAPRSRRRGVPAAERRRQILEAAVRVFLSEGLDGASTRRLAQAAGTTDAVLYRHFPSKRALFEETVRAPLAGLLAELRDVTGSGGLDAAALRRHLELMTRVTPLLGVAVFGDLDEGREFYGEHIAPLLDQAGARVQRRLDRAGLGELDGRLVYTAVFGMHMGLSFDAALRGIDVDLDAASAGVGDLLVRGLSVPGGDRGAAPSFEAGAAPAWELVGSGGDRPARMSPELRRAAIIADALPVYRAKGPARTRTGDVAEAAGVTEALIYQYFSSKERLFAEVLSAASEDMVWRFRDAVARLLAAADPGSPGSLRGFHEATLRVMVDMAPLLGIAVFSGSAEGRAAYAERFYPALAEAAAELSGRVYGSSADNVVLVATTTMHFAVALDAEVTGRALDVPGVAAQLSRLVSDGLGPAFAG